MEFSGNALIPLFYLVHDDLQTADEFDHGSWEGRLIQTVSYQHTYLLQYLIGLEK